MEILDLCDAIVIEVELLQGWEAIDMLNGCDVVSTETETCQERQVRQVGHGLQLRMRPHNFLHDRVRARAKGACQAHRLVGRDGIQAWHINCARDMKGWSEARHTR
jgi:hypothetical protein